MRLLLAEDELELSNALVAILGHSGYTAEAVYDGEAALERLQASTYDAVILDIMMPKLNGLEVLRTIREAGNRTPVIILTAKSETDDKVAGLDAGADDYLSKPFSSKELLARIRAITRREPSEPSRSATLSLGNTTLNTETYKLTAPSGSAVLPNKEFRIMQELMNSGDKILAQKELLDKIWGDDASTDQNVLWVYISYIRKKLENIGSNTVIKAHRNAGYSLVIENDS